MLWKVVNIWLIVAIKAVNDSTDSGMRYIVFDGNIFLGDFIFGV